MHRNISLQRNGDLLTGSLLHKGVTSGDKYTAELYAVLVLARQQAQDLSVALAQPITPAPELTPPAPVVAPDAVALAQPIAPALQLTPPAPVVAPDVTRWHLPYSAGCLAGRMVYHTGLKGPSVLWFNLSLAPAHFKVHGCHPSSLAAASDQGDELAERLVDLPSGRKEQWPTQCKPACRTTEWLPFATVWPCSARVHSIIGVVLKTIGSDGLGFITHPSSCV
ncbi:UNVERIFIED_CONTAM: hypothetical protein FKN15_039242 [Acipenser sinensis]